MNQLDNAKYRTAIGFLTLAIPFLAMLFMIGVNIQRLTHDEYIFKVEGYDPRDMLRGHYLTFSYKWPEKEGVENLCSGKSIKCCACISGETRDPSVSFYPCDFAKGNEICMATVEVNSSGRVDLQPNQSLRQYYIPEAQASELESMLVSGNHTFEVGMVFQSRNKAQLKTLYIDGRSLSTVLKEPH